MHSPAFPKLMFSRCAPSITLWIPRPLQNSSNQPLHQGMETCRSIGESDQLLSLVCLSWVFCMLNLIIHGTSLVDGIARNLADGFKAVEPIQLCPSYFPVLLCQPLPPAPATMLWFGEDFSPLTLDMCGENPLEVSLSLVLGLETTDLCVSWEHNWPQFWRVAGNILAQISWGSFANPTLIPQAGHVWDSSFWNLSRQLDGDHVPFEGVLWAQGKLLNPSTQS